MNAKDMQVQQMEVCEVIRVCTHRPHVHSAGTHGVTVPDPTCRAVLVSQKTYLKNTFSNINSVDLSASAEVCSLRQILVPCTVPRPDFPADCIRTAVECLHMLTFR